MEQAELALDNSMLNLMHAPTPQIGWRRAHQKTQACGERRADRKRINVGPVIVNAANQTEKLKMMEQLQNHPAAAPLVDQGTQERLI